MRTGARLETPIQYGSFSDAHGTRWLQESYASLNMQPESTRYRKQVFHWRNAFRPRRVQVLLVAESHVAEQSGDTSVKVAIPHGILNNAFVPNGFCRLVYCLGYGESELCGPKPQSNPGTIQFWDLFGAAGFERSLERRCPRRKGTAISERLAWKQRVLGVLAKKGVWLEDASVIGLYSSGRRLTRGARYRQLIRESFERCVWPAVASDTPTVWVIGRGVGKALSSLPMISTARVISQPQDRDVARYRSDLQRMVTEITSNGRDA